MLRAIDFNDELHRHTREIGNIASDRHLTSEMRALEFKDFERSPESTLGISCALPETASSFAAEVADGLLRRHSRPLLHPPLEGRHRRPSTAVLDAENADPKDRLRRVG